MSVLRNIGVIYGSLAALGPQQRQLSALTTGQAVPDVAWQTLAGETRRVSTLRGVKRAITLVSPTCSSCVDYLRSVAEREHAPDPTDPTVTHRVIVSLGDLPGTLRLFESAAVAADSLPDDVTVLIDPERETAKAWGMAATPSTIILDEQMRVVRQFIGAGEPPERRAVASAPVGHEHIGAEEVGV